MECSVMAKGELDRVKGLWSPDDDKKLRQLVHCHGARNWSVTSKSMPGRLGKCCRQQWYNQLSPEVKQRAFTHEEDEITDKAHAKYENKWATICRILNNHTDNEISQ